MAGSHVSYLTPYCTMQQPRRRRRCSGEPARCRSRTRGHLCVAAGMIAFPLEMIGRRLDTNADIDALLTVTKRIAVLGIKTEAQQAQPAFTVPQYLLSVGFEIIPVPVYYPEV